MHDPFQLAALAEARRTCEKLIPLRFILSLKSSKDLTTACADLPLSLPSPTV